MEENLRQAPRAAKTARYVSEEAVAAAEASIRRHPLPAIGMAALTGTLAAGSFGFAIRWFARARH